jgi:ribosome biogenesis GTPase
MLEAYGWGEALQQQFSTYADHNLSPARVLVQHRGLYRIIAEGGELNASPSGKLAYEAPTGSLPVTGDWVAIAARPQEGSATIHHVLDRKSAFARLGPTGAAQVIAANLDVAFLVASLNADLNARRLERYLAVARESGAEPVILLTKADVAEDIDEQHARVEAIASGAPIHILSALTGAGLDALAPYLTAGRTAALLGSSGVGKSTLANALLGSEHMATREITDDRARGRHTTTHRELILLPGGGLLLDSPGMRELSVWGADEGVSASFEDVEALIEQCRFHDCRHKNEPGCAVRGAIEAGELDEARFQGYQKLQRELAFEGRKEDPLARAEMRKIHTQRVKNYRARQKARSARYEDD